MEEKLPKTTDQELTNEELDAQAGEQLPDREAMSLLNANVAAPVNAAAALQGVADGSAAVENAQQTAKTDQSNSEERDTTDAQSMRVAAEAPADGQTPAASHP